MQINFLQVSFQQLKVLWFEFIVSMKINLQRRETVLNSLSPFHLCRCIKGFFVIQVWKMYGCPENQFRGLKISITITQIFEALTWSVGVTMCFLFIYFLLMYLLFKWETRKRRRDISQRHNLEHQLRRQNQCWQSTIMQTQDLQQVSCGSIFSCDIAVLDWSKHNCLCFGCQTHSWRFPKVCCDKHSWRLSTHHQKSLWTQKWLEKVSLKYPATTNILKG